MALFPSLRNQQSESASNDGYAFKSRLHPLALLWDTKVLKISHTQSAGYHRIVTEQKEKISREKIHNVTASMPGMYVGM